MDPSCDLVTDFEAVRVGADGGDSDDRAGKVAPDDGAGDRETGDRGVFPVCESAASQMRQHDKMRGRLSRAQRNKMFAVSTYQ